MSTLVVGGDLAIVEEGTVSGCLKMGRMESGSEFTLACSGEMGSATAAAIIANATMAFFMAGSACGEETIDGSGHR